MTGTTLRTLRIVSGIVLLAVGLIHLFLVFDGVGGTLGVLFILNAIAGVVLGVGVLAARGGLLRAALLLGLAFDVVSLLALLLALTVGLFGITEVWTFTLVPETVLIEAIGVVVLAITAGLGLRRTQTV
ncbi:hypothetical protein [Frondihabitans australicus]|uniref:Uncharacterized protein n=1 Tax=Frondihabitans australicus TaxID=386892 RepID=A0A495IJF4_9MICO|nr:hypothetical protein [Frondihabitans australicus]RKR75256.1 hypothetical protein C8E83_2395 [Frondihabitans australicus]